MPSLTNVTVANTATALWSAAGTRLKATIANNSSQTVYVGPDASVATAAGSNHGGIPIQANSSAELDQRDGVDQAWYGIVASGTADVRIIS